MSGLVDIARMTCTRRGLLPEGCPVLVMVSGGGDSVALLRLLASGGLGEHPLRVLHVNHQLRGEAADSDEAFVAELCDQVGVDVRIERHDVAGHAAERGLNLEDAGRRIRYRLAHEELDSLCAGLGVDPQEGRIAVAHTLDDRVETFFARAITGSGMGGLASIAPRRGRIVRPLIDCEREAVRSYLAGLEQAWREDATNSDIERQRAFIRAKIVPLAEQLNPAVRSVLARSMDLLADDDALLTSMAESFADSLARIEDGRLILDRSVATTLERAMARRTVRAALLRAFPEASRLEAFHVEAVVDGLVGGEPFARDLPGGLRAVSEYGSMVVSRGNPVDVSVVPTLLPRPGCADLGEAGTLRADVVSGERVEGTPDSVVVDESRLSGDLMVDHARPGDRMRTLGMKGTRKLSDLLIDAKVPRRLRASIPVVRDRQGIVWLAGIRMSEDYRVTGATRHAVRLTWTDGKWRYERPEK